MGVVLLWIAAGLSRKSICERLGCRKVTGMHGNVVDFMIRGRLTRILGRFRAQGSALTRNVSSTHCSKNLLQRGILYRHEKILLRQGRLQARTQENYMYHSDGFSLISRDRCIRLGSRFVWYENMLFCCGGLQWDFMCPRLMCIKVASMHGNAIDSIIRGRLTSILGHFRAQGSALTRNVSRLYGSKNLQA